MDELKYECIILIKADSNNVLRRKNINEIIQLIHNILGKNKKIIKETLSLAYEIQNCKKADVLAFEFQIKSKAKYLINLMKREFNTHKEILSYKIVPKEEWTEKNNYDIYLVYEFDYGDTIEQIKPNITIFGGYQTRLDAETKALELLEEAVYVTYGAV